MAGREVPVELTYRHGRRRRRASGGAEVDHADGAAQRRPVIDEQAEFDRAVTLAADSDVAVVVVGTNEEVESEGFDRTSLALPGRQDELVRAVAAANPRTVVVVNSAHRCCCRGPTRWPPCWCLVPRAGVRQCSGRRADRSCRAGWATAGDLAGLGGGLPPVRPVNGELPYDEGLLIGYRWYLATERAPLFPFGHGLGYTTWSYEGMVVDGDTVTVSVRNSGDRPGREVVQLYASRPDSAVERAPHWLVGSAVVEAAAGERADAPSPSPITISGTGIAPRMPGRSSPARTSCTPVARWSTCRSALKYSALTGAGRSLDSQPTS